MLLPRLFQAKTVSLILKVILKYYLKVCHVQTTVETNHSVNHTICYSKVPLIKEVMYYIEFAYDFTFKYFDISLQEWTKESKRIFEMFKTNIGTVFSLTYK